MEKEISCKHACSFLEIVRKEKPESVGEFFGGVIGNKRFLIEDHDGRVRPITKAYLTDPKHWISNECSIAIFENVAKIFGGARPLYHIGRKVIMDRFSGLKGALLSVLVSPQAGLKLGNSRFGRKLNAVKRFLPVVIDKKSGRMIVRVIYKKGVEGSRHACDYAQGTFSGYVELFYKFEGIKETKCILRGDPFCEHLVKWEPKDFTKRIHRIVFGRYRLLKSALRQLEERDQQNQELIFDLENKVRVRTEKVQQANRELKAVNRRLRRLVSSGRRYLANASHELNNPLTAIRGNIQLILDGQVGLEEGMDILKLVQSDVDRLTRLADNLLTINAGSYGNWKESFERVSFDQVLQQACKGLRSLIKKKQIKFDYRVKDDVVIYGNGDLLTELSYNLIENAIKYTPAGGSVFVSLASVYKTARLTVKDTGPGISKRHHSKIFQDFFRINRVKSREMGGSGLGLSICKLIAEAHSGKLSLKSSVGKGSIFVFEMPKAKAPKQRTRVRVGIGPSFQ